MKKFINKNKLGILGAALGSIGGYLYYAFIGCVSGVCPISSNPILSILYGGLLGYLFLDMFKKRNNKDVAQK